LEIQGGDSALPRISQAFSTTAGLKIWYLDLL
jgi:hypothetical protein